MTNLELITLLSLLPSDAHVVVAENGLNPAPPPGSLREGQSSGGWIVDGFTAEELRRENIEPSFFAEENLIVIHLARNSAGQDVA